MSKLRPESPQQEEVCKQDEVHRLQQELARQQRLYAEQEHALLRLEKEHASVLNSKVWRCAEFFRRLLRVHLLNWFPSLQAVFIPRCKRLYRKYLALPLVRMGVCKDAYARWMELEQEALDAAFRQVESEMERFSSLPTISLVMPVYNVKPEWLEKAFRSVQQQTYPHWQLCIADDCSTDQRLQEVLEHFAATDERVSITYLPKNRGIAGASNAALALASGEFVGLLDNDDELAPHALLEVVKAINREPDADVLYSDEDKISEGGHRYDPFFKPDWSPDTLRSYNYLCHFTVIQRELLSRVGGFRAGFDGSQDYDLFLRVTELAKKIVHIPAVLYHWRAIEGSVGKRGDAKMYAYASARKALAEHLKRIGIDGEVEEGLFLGSYRIHYALAHRPEVAIIIPTRDKADILRRCVDSILARTSYASYHIYIVDNGSEEQATYTYYQSLHDHPAISILEYRKPFNFSAINNYAVKEVQGDYLLFLNNDTEVISPEWLEEMLGYAQRPDVGAVGSLLYYSNDTIQHGGIIVGIGGVAGHSHKYFPRLEYGYFGRLKTVQNLSAVTAACMLTKRSVFEEVGGFEEKLSHAFNDVDLCLKMRERGYLVVYTPFAELYHHESISRGYENTPQKRRRFGEERQFCEERWGTLLQQGDPYYNPNLSLIREDFSIGLEKSKHNVS